MQFTCLPLFLTITRVHADPTSSTYDDIGAQPVDSWKTKVVTSLGIWVWVKTHQTPEHQINWQMDGI